jgi:hypothetical protein
MKQYELIPGIANLEVAKHIHPNGIGYCPNCKAHAPIVKKVCTAIDCHRFINGKPKELATNEKRQA